MMRLSVVELRHSLADALNRAEYRGETIIIHRREKDAAALISIEDLRLLERLIREEEDRIDATAARAARKESEERVPFEDVRRTLGLTDEPGRRPVPDRDDEGRAARSRTVARKGL